MSEKKTLHEHAIAHGQIAPPAPEGNPYLVEHRIAAQLHGWAAHEHHYGPVLLTDDEYEGALEAGRKGYVPHKPAIPVEPTEAEITARHAEALAASSEPEAVAARAKIVADAEAAAKVPDDAPTPAQSASKLRRGLPASPPPASEEGAK